MLNKCLDINKRENIIISNTINWTTTQVTKQVFVKWSHSERPCRDDEIILSGIHHIIGFSCMKKAGEQRKDYSKRIYYILHVPIAY